MIQLDEVHIEEVRGIRKLTLALNRKTFAIQGPNGSGKSGVVDAIEFGLTGDISRLSGKGTAGLSVKAHGPHVDARDYPDKAFVRLKLYIPHLNKSATLTRKVKSAKSFVLEPDEADIRAVLSDVEDHPEFTLTRREIIKFILTEAGNRSKEIQSLLRLDAIEGTRASLKTATTRTASKHATAVSKAHSSANSLCRHLDLENLEATEVLIVVNKHRRTLGLEEIAKLTATTSFTEGMTDEPQESKEPDKESAFRDIKALNDSLAGELNREPTASDDLKALANRLEDEPELLVALQRRSFIETGLEFVDTDECPLCNTPWDIAALKAHLEEKLAKSKQAEEVDRELKAAARRLSSEVEALRGLVASVLPLAKFLGDEDAGAVIQSWLDDLLAFKTELSTVEGIIRERERLSNDWKRAPAKLGEALERLATKIKALPDRSEATKATKFLILAQDRLSTYQMDKREVAKRERAADLARIAYKAYCDAAETVLTELYKDVQDTFATWYRSINRDDEGKFTAKLSPSEGKLDLEVDFHERGLFPPGAYHSEGHQDGMGLCLYLALMSQLLGDRFCLAVLDDVVMSVDNQHRKELCTLLKSQFPNTQFIITTHDQAWFHQMRHAALIGRDSAVMFRGWTPEDGPLVSDAKDAWEDIDSALAENDVHKAVACLRRHLEHVSRELADGLGAHGPIRLDGDHDLGDLLPNVVGRFNKLLKKCSDSAQAWKNDDAKSDIETRKIAFREASRKSNVEQWAVNKAVHYNAWEDFVREDFQPVVDAFKGLLDCLRCGSCGSWLYVVPRKGPEETLRCSCNRVSLNMSEP